MASMVVPSGRLSATRGPPVDNGTRPITGPFLTSSTQMVFAPLVRAVLLEKQHYVNRLAGQWFRLAISKGARTGGKTTG